ncbi:MAG: transketolase, partial [Thermoplasmata archaeon]
LVDKLRAFRFRTVEIDGHDIREILAAFAAARRARDDPNAIVAHTVAGKGVSFLENSPSGHDRTFTKDEADRALAELGVGSAEVRP